MAEQAKPAAEPAQQVPSQRLEDTDIYRAFVVGEPTWRERTAARVAFAVLWLFGGSLAVGFGLAFFVLIRSAAPGPDEKAVTTALEALRLIGTLFGPLLAFILGYYFTKKEE
jgi:uncharacterized BrkB/YihY/UPF0761 family membrane protein